MRMWGGPGMFIWTWAKRGGHGPRGEDLGGVWQRAMTSTPGRTNPSSFTTAALGPARARGENSKPGRTIWPKVNGGLTTGACWAPRHKRTASWHAGPFAGGLRGTGRGACTWRLYTGPPMGSRKWLGATRQECAEPQRAVFRDRWLHCTCCLNQGPAWTPSRLPACQNHTGFGMVVLNCMQEFKNRPFYMNITRFSLLISLFLFQVFIFFCNTRYLILSMQ